MLVEVERIVANSTERSGPLRDTLIKWIRYKRGGTSKVSIKPTKEKTMKRTLLILAVALFLSSLAIPTSARADGGAGSTACGDKLCKP